MNSVLKERENKRGKGKENKREDRGLDSNVTICPEKRDRVHCAALGAD